MMSSNHCSLGQGRVRTWLSFINMVAYVSNTGGRMWRLISLLGSRTIQLQPFLCGLQSFYLPKSTNLVIKYIYIYNISILPHPKTPLSPIPLKHREIITICYSMRECNKAELNKHADSHKGRSAMKGSRWVQGKINSNSYDGFIAKIR